MEVEAPVVEDPNRPSYDALGNVSQASPLGTDFHSGPARARIADALSVGSEDTSLFPELAQLVSHP